MNRRRFLRAATGGLFALIGASHGAWQFVPAVPKRPDPDLADAFAWIEFRDQSFFLVLPRAEMGQNIATALKQVACTELAVDWDSVFIELYDTARPRVKATVGSESIQKFVEPLAQACASLRSALLKGLREGQVEVENRPRSELRSLRTGGYVGISPEIEQGRDIVLGRPLFAADISAPGLLFGRVLRAAASMEIVSRPKRWNEQGARSVSGFIALVENCGPSIGKAQGLGIVASRPGALKNIEEALQIEWHIEDEHPLSEYQKVIDVDAHAVNGSYPYTTLDGDPLEGPWDVDLRLDLPFAAHAAIEPRAAVAKWEEGRLNVWAGSQDPFYVRDHLAKIYRLRKSEVKVSAKRIGGGFGSKTICTCEAEAAALSLSVQAPVKVQWTREQEFSQSFHRPPSSHRVNARLDGVQLTDWHHRAVSSHIIFTPAAMPIWMQEGADFVTGDPGVARGMKIPYKVVRKKAEFDAIRLPVHGGPWRGLGAGPNCLAVESAIDEASVVAGEDPLAFRLRHCEDTRLANVLERVGTLANWAGNHHSDLGGSRRGRGVACGIYKDTSYAAAVVDVVVDVDGNVTVEEMWLSHDCGLTINPDQVVAQCEGNLVWSIGMILSDFLPIEGGHVVAKNFLESPIPRFTQVPPISVDLVPSNLDPSGAGETAMVAGPAAIANAIASATGFRPSKFPISTISFKDR